MRAPLAAILLAATFMAAAVAAPIGAAEPAAVPASAPTVPPLSIGLTEASAPKLEFSEIWAYLMNGEERFLDPSMPVTDLGYFGAEIGVTGSLARVPPRTKLAGFKGRVHLVVSELSNFALTHFALDPAFPLRDALVADIAASAKDYDGVQIDFEAVSPRDNENFYAFLGLLKGALGPKLLSVALPARMKDSRDGLGYERVAGIADRIVVMAYDEHWSSSEPGPVASMDWCRRVSAYAVAKLGAEKLVMGLPFYGRAWADKSLSRAYKYSSLTQLIGEKGLADVQRKDQIPYLEYEETVKVKVYFDDRASIQARLGMYRAASVRNVAFWRLGQEDAEVWGAMAAAPAPAPSAATPTDAGPAPTAPPAALPAVPSTLIIRPPYLLP